jgi:hypothetical protein
VKQLDQATKGSVNTNVGQFFEFLKNPWSHFYFFENKKTFGFDFLKTSKFK